jgi:hypothetical protein
MDAKLGATRCPKLLFVGTKVFMKVAIKGYLLFILFPH